MGLFNKTQNNSGNLNQEYVRIGKSNMEEGFQMAKEKGIDVQTEPYKIVEMVPLPGQVNGEHYWNVADFILAEYPTKLALQVSAAFGNMAPQLGFDPFGKIMVGTQFVDRKAGSPMITRMSFMKEHPVCYEYLTERNCPERTESALELLSAAVFQFPDINSAKSAFKQIFDVPEMKEGVKEKIYSINEDIAKYVTR